MGKGGDVNENDDAVVVSKCPFSSGSGYSTKQTRQEYLNIKSMSSHASKSSSADAEGQEEEEEANSPPPSSLQADMDVTKPLYFWQLHSLIGRQPVIDICRDFYDFVYLDFDAPWFRQVFEQVAPKEHHIMAQAAYWVDAMGGGRVYHGGLMRLNYHHRYNAEEIMNADGAARWMYHMKRSLRKNHRHFKADPRILPCIVEFLETKMRVYARDHQWEFDAGDFEIEDFYPRQQEEEKKEEKAV